MDLFRPSTCLGRGRREAWITGTSPVMTTASRGVALHCNHIRRTGQPWGEPGDDGLRRSEYSEYAGNLHTDLNRTAVEQVRP